MKKTETILFTRKDCVTDEISAWYCIKMAWLYFVMFIKKVYEYIDRAVHRNPWLALFFIALIESSICCGLIMSARAERDNSNAMQYKLEREVNSLKCQLEALK